jgi:hypothetical protein
MLARSLAVAIATATMLLAGCQTFTAQGFLPTDARDSGSYTCSYNADEECYVQVHPYDPRWVPDYIIADRGKKLVLWINNGVGEFGDSSITMKQGVDQILDCSEKIKKLVVKCKVSTGADPTKTYGYTIHANGVDYDPFIWPR